MLLICVAWTSWLIFLALTPNTAANLLMDTNSYDNGQFWLFNDANPQIILAGAIGLLLVDFCYVLVTLRMLFWRDKLFGSAYQNSHAPQSGSPASLTYGFAGFLSLNAFDLSAAVLFPIVTLVYCYYNFDVDREVYLTYLEKLPPGSFEHLARSFADQSEIALFRVNFDSLRIDLLLDFALRISMNLTFCYRFERVLQAIVWTRHHGMIMQRLNPTKTTPASQNSVPKGLSALFVAICVIIFLSTHKAIADSKALDECCPCLILIDVDIAPKTYQEWRTPIDAYEKIKTLAEAGLLTSLQLINRQLLKWPDELQVMYVILQNNVKLFW
ncbi:uncharacterized protein PITG_09077 [Phytophthora infestans T30-4]|uniref:Transmembrane protein n=1 Tax=Phytophthora infestans (strain T30-4) TaxID=403677 RepID=D0NBM9_PHYIT|nr:uncharacterized protein PITG_09077 [Phytophthora infestans T30-4]EEY55184.1 conserved hypothetical protein [Phytophthora infestans T30-4]|eukprot:XP_002903408.1 conserved hypothetical protein [Phytophthora infestans T30-4]